MKVQFNSSLLNDFIKKSKQVKSEAIQIRAVDGTINLINCDLNNQVSRKFNSEVIEEGTVVIPKDLYPLIKDDEFMTVANDGIILNTREIHTNLQDNDYPTLEDDYKYNMFDLSDKEIKELLEVEHAVSKDETKVLLTGIHIKNNEFVAVDGYRMSERYGSFTSEKEITISDYKLLKNLKGQIKATCGDRCINYQVGDYNYSNKLVDGEYIDVDKLKPKDYNTRVTLDKKPLLEVLKAMNKASKSERNRIVKLKIMKDKIEFSTSNERVALVDFVKCDTEGDDLEIAFNSTYLLEAVEKMGSTIVMEFTTNVNPVIIKSAGKYELLLPVRIASNI